MALPTYAHCVILLQQSISIISLPSTQLPTCSSGVAVLCCCGPMLGQRDRWMDTILFHRPCSAYHVGTASNVENASLHSCLNPPAAFYLELSWGWMLQCSTVMCFAVLVFIVWRTNSVVGQFKCFPVLWRCWLGGRKGIRPGFTFLVLAYLGSPGERAVKRVCVCVCVCVINLWLCVAVSASSRNRCLYCRSPTSFSCCSWCDILSTSATRSSLHSAASAFCCGNIVTTAYSCSYPLVGRH